MANQVAISQWSSANNICMLTVFQNTDNLNKNTIMEVFWINDRWPVVHIFLFYVWLPISWLIVD